MKKFFSKKRIIWIVIIGVILLLAGYGLFGRKKTNNSIQTDTVKRQNLKLTVLSTGQVVSTTDISLSFQASGTVRQIAVKEGEKVTAGRVLASLDLASAQATLTQARGAVAQAQAAYEKVLAGASTEQITVAEKAVDAARITLENAKASLSNTTNQQDTALENSYRALLNSTPSAQASSGNLSTATVSVAGAYTKTAEGSYTLKLETSGGGYNFSVYGLESRQLTITRGFAQSLGASGLVITVSSTGTLNSGDTWTITLPNTQATDYLTNYNSYLAAQKTRESAIATATATVKSAEVAFSQAQANLDQQRAKARPADIDSAQAQILAAQGQLAAAEATVSNSIIKAPADGTITSVSVKVGELASATKPIMVLQDVGNLHVETNVSEANIAQLKPGQSVDVTFDALGPDRVFKAVVQTVNPSSTVVSGVVNYKVVASLEKMEEIKPGMTANMTILIAQKDGVLAVPSRGILTHNTARFVRVVDDPKKKTYHEVEVKTGLEGDGGLTEVLSGLKDGQEVVTFIKQ